MMQIIGDRNVRLIPDVLVGGNNGSTNSLVDGLLSMILWNQTAKLDEKTIPLQAKSQPTTTSEPTPSSNDHQPVVIDFPLDGNIAK